MNYLQKKKLAFMSIINNISGGVAGFVRTVMGLLPLTLNDCVDSDSIIDYKIYGESVQDGTPTPDAPVEIGSVGERTINLYTGEREYTFSATTNVNHHSFYEALEIGKTYTLYCYIDNSLGVGNAAIRMSVGKTVDGTDTWNYNESNNITAGKEGYTKTTFTIPDNYNGRLNMMYKATSGGTAIFSDIMLVEGNYTLSKLPAYIKPYRIPIEVSGVNLFNKDTLRLSNKYHLSQGGLPTFYTGSRCATLNPINVSDYKNINVSYANTAMFMYSLFDNENNLIERVAGKYSGADVDVSSASYMYVCFYDVTVEDMEDVQIKSCATTNIYARFPLMKFGDYSDYIDFANGKIVRNVVRNCLQGSEAGWNTSAKRFYLPLSTLNIKCLGTDVIGIMSSALPSKPWNLIRNSGIGIATYVNNRIDIRADNFWETVDDAKAYMKLNPISYIAPCLEPWEEDVDLPQLETIIGTNIVDVDTLIRPSSAEITYYSTSKE